MALLDSRVVGSMAEIILDLATEIQDANTRSTILRELHRQLGYRVDFSRMPSPRLDVIELLRACEGLPDALPALADVLELMFPNRPGLRDLRNLIKAVPPPRLTRDERRELLELAGKAAGVPLQAVYRSVVGEFGRPFDPRITDAVALLLCLEEETGLPGEPPALLFGVKALAERVAEAELRAEFERWLGGHLRRSAAPRSWSTTLTRQPNPAPRAHFVVQIEHDGIGEGYQMSTWAQLHGNDLGIRLSAAEEISAESELPRQIDQQLGEMLANYTSGADDPNATVVEFILPRDLLSLPVDQWEVGAAWGDTFAYRLGVGYPVVLRSAERRKKKPWHQGWRTRTELLRARSHLPDEAAVYYLGQPHPAGLGPLSADLRDDALFCYVQAFPPRDCADLTSDELGVVVSTGFPAAVWCRSGFDPGLAGSLKEILQLYPVADLPAAVQELRRLAHSHDLDGHLGNHLALLWDEYGRWPDSPDLLECPTS